MAQTFEIAVIGGGASGLVAAIAAARLTDGVKIFERCDRVGKKLLATGNGRCNLSNVGVLSPHCHGGRRVHLPRARSLRRRTRNGLF